MTLDRPDAIETPQASRSDATERHLDGQRRRPGSTSIDRRTTELALANPAADSTEIWEIKNSSGGWFHPVHIHLIDFQILEPQR